MKTKTKEELIDLIEELQEKVEELENDVEYWQDEYNDIEEERDMLMDQVENVEVYEGIKDLDNFIWKLKLENLYTDELKEFIEHYLKFYND